MSENDAAIRSTRGQRIRRRLPSLAALLLTQLLYFPINRLASGGVALVTPLDRDIPFWPAWAIPYLLSLAWWQACFVWATVEMDDKLYRAFAIGTLSVMVASYVIYVAYPTYVIRPIVLGDDWQSTLIRFVYGHDRAYNAFPSSHAYLTVLISLFWSRWRPRLRALWAAIAVIVILATLFTKQHYVLDPIGGIAIAYLGYRFGVWWAERGGSRIES